jgi:hypothetical protein
MKHSEKIKEIIKNKKVNKKGKYFHFIFEDPVNITSYHWLDRSEVIGQHEKVKRLNFLLLLRFSSFYLPHSS